MRGILVLVLGAVLIWVGVRSGSDSHAAGESSSEDEVVRLDEDGPRDDSGVERTCISAGDCGQRFVICHHIAGQ